MSEEPLCIICKKEKGVAKISDAISFPERYNNKPICKQCNDEREILKNTI